MKLDSYCEVEQLTREMVAIPSVNKSKNGESAVSEYIKDWFMKLDYFKSNPDQVFMSKTVNDFVDRHSTIAYIKGNGSSNKTVILLGHIDTVDVKDYGSIQEYAFKVDELAAKLKETFTLSEDVLKDIESGEYMFGRGALDMKSGVAAHMVVMKYFAENTDKLNGNLVFLAECDEEDNSIGVMSALKDLVAIKEKENFEYITCINTDFCTAVYDGDPNRYIHFGAIGKLLPCFAVFGKEAHVGSAFDAFDPNLLLAEITRKISLNTELCDVSMGEVTLPPISLKITDTKDTYTVQTASVAFGYYNYLLYNSSPDSVMEKSKKIAEEAFEDIIRYLNVQYEKFCVLNHSKFEKLPWNTRVYSWKEWNESLKEKYGDEYTDSMDRFARELMEKEPELDMRLFGLRMCEESRKWSSDASPMIIVFFGSAYNARVEMTGRSDSENAMIEAVNKAVKSVSPDANRIIRTRMYYPYISDLSFMAVCDPDEKVYAMIDNAPMHGYKFNYPLEQIKKINVPVVNIGTYGKDGHMLTERVDKWHTFQNVPNLTLETVENLLK